MRMPVNVPVKTSELELLALKGHPMRLVKKFLRDEAGATALEYSMIGGLVSIIIIVALTSIGSNVSTMFLGPVSAALSP